MGGRGASIKSLIAKYENHKKKISNSSSAITRAERKKLIEAGYLKREEKKATPKSESKNSFDRAKEIKNFSNHDYRKENTPRGAKSFATMFQKNGSLTNGVLAHGEEYVIAKWANQKGYKNLDKKSKADIGKIIGEYAKGYNPKLSRVVTSNEWDWYKY